jgi:hypothetical protein
MTDESWRDARLLKLAGVYNAEQARWNVRQSTGALTFDVTRETDEVWPNDVEVIAQFPTLDAACLAKAYMQDIAAAQAFIDAAF